MEYLLYMLNYILKTLNVFFYPCFEIIVLAAFFTMIRELGGNDFSSLLAGVFDGVPSLTRL